MAMFGAIAFVPLFVQGVMGGTATEAGQVLTPLFLGWVATSILGARLTVSVGYRRVAVTGVALLTLGFIALSVMDEGTTRAMLLTSVFVLGAGMGLSMLSLLLAVQHGVDRSQLGLATSLNQFARSVGAAVGVAVMGAVMARSLSGVTLPGGPEALAAGTFALEGEARHHFAVALERVFATGGLMSGIALLASIVLPPVSFEQKAPVSTGERMLAAEMANLDSESEPAAVD
jgi:MFS family permease